MYSSKASNALLKVKKWHLFVFTLLIKIFVSYLFHVLSSYLEIDNSRKDEFSLSEILFIIVLIGPLIETFVFQFIAQEVGLYFLDNNKGISLLLSIVISSVLFSLTHYDSWYHIFITFVSGVVYGSFYISLRLKGERTILSFLLTSVVHSCFNLSEFLFYGN